MWLVEELGLQQLADRIDRIDIYTSTLERVRQSIIKLVEAELERQRPKSAQNRVSA